MAINIITGFASFSREALDKRSGPYDSTAQALATLTTLERYVGLDVFVIENPIKDENGNYIGGDLLKYYFNGGITDDDLILIPGSDPDLTIDWGDITGDINNQTDLINVLDTKADQSDLDITNSNVATNTSDITSNRTDIDTNTGDISNNTLVIYQQIQITLSSNRTDIDTNTGDIATNT